VVLSGLLRGAITSCPGVSRACAGLFGECLACDRDGGAVHVLAIEQTAWAMTGIPAGLIDVLLPRIFRRALGSPAAAVALTYALKSRRFCSGTPIFHARLRVSAALRWSSRPVVATPAIAFSNDFFREDIARMNATLQKIHYDFAAAKMRTSSLRVSIAGIAIEPHRREADKFHDSAHGIGRVLTAACTRAGNRLRLPVRATRHQSFCPRHLHLRLRKTS